MAIIEFNQGMAESWMAKAEELNQRTGNYMNAVANCLQEIKADSVGEMVDEVVATGAQVLEHSAGLVHSLSGIVSGVRGIIGRLLAASAEMVGEVVSNRGAMTGF
jgi:hypothetical protein